MLCREGLIGGIETGECGFISLLVTHKSVVNSSILIAPFVEQSNSIVGRWNKSLSETVVISWVGKWLGIRLTEHNT